MRLKRKLFRIKVVRQLVKLLRQGTSPRKMALSVTLGLLLGIVPTFGFVAPLCGVIALWLRLNVPLALSVLYIMFPVHVALFVPFLRLGEWVFDLPSLPFSPDLLMDMIRTDWWDTMQLIGVNNLAAVGVWLICSIPTSFLLYSIFFLLFRKYKVEQKSAPVSH